MPTTNLFHHENKPFSSRAQDLFITSTNLFCRDKKGRDPIGIARKSRGAGNKLRANCLLIAFASTKWARGRMEKALVGDARPYYRLMIKDGSKRRDFAEGERRNEEVDKRAGKILWPILQPEQRKSEVEIKK